MNFSQSEANNNLLKAEISFSWYDYIFFVGTLTLSSLIGIYFGCFGSKQSTVSEYLMGNKAMKPLPIALSLIASHVSGITFIGYPVETYRHGAYLLLKIISLIFNSVALTCIYLPVFFNLDITSIYEYLEMRFDRNARLLTSFLYALTAFLYLPIVIYTASLTCSIATGINMRLITLVLCCICILYTSISGLKGVIWTDTLQFSVMTLTITIVFGLGLKFSKGFGVVWEKAVEGQRLDIFDFNIDPTIRNSFWSSVIGFIFSTLALSTVTQSATQKYLTLSKFRDVKLCIIYYTIGMSIITVLNVFLGLIIYAKYSDCDPFTNRAITKSDQLVPYFVMDVARDVPGLPGVFVGGIVSAAFSTLSTSWNGLAGTIYLDFLKRRIKRNITEKTASNILKVLVVIEGIVCMCTVFIIERLDEIIPLSVSFLAMTYGPMLGIFSLGLLFPKANSKGAFYGTLVGLISAGTLVFPSKYFMYRGWISYPSKPISTDGCQFFNDTFTTSTHFHYNTTEKPSIPSVFKVSFFYHALFGALVTTVVGLVISFATNKNLNSIDKKLISPVSRCLLNTRKESFESVRYSSVQEALNGAKTTHECDAKL